MVCAGHARLSSDRIATAMVVRLVTTRNITMLENASNSLNLMQACSWESEEHAQCRPVFARNALSAKGLAKTWRNLE